MGGAGQRLHAGGTAPARGLRAEGSGCARSIATLMCRWRGGREGPGCHQLSGWHLLGLPTHSLGSGGVVASCSGSEKHLGKLER